MIKANGRGFSFVEVLVSLGVLSVGLMATMDMFHRTDRTIQNCLVSYHSALAAESAVAFLTVNAGAVEDVHKWIGLPSAYTLSIDRETRAEGSEFTVIKVRSPNGLLFRYSTPFAALTTFREEYQ